METIKIIELIGSSPSSWQEAAENAFNKAVKTVKNIRGMEAVGWTAKVQDGKIVEYHTNVKIAFSVGEAM